MSTKAESFNWVSFNTATAEVRRKMAQEWMQLHPNDQLFVALAREAAAPAAGQATLEGPDELVLLARKFNEAIHRQSSTGVPTSRVRVELAGIARFACWWFVVLSMIGAVAALIAASR